MLVIECFKWIFSLFSIFFFFGLYELYCECAHNLLEVLLEVISSQQGDGYYVAYKPITFSSILFMFVEMKFIHCHSCVMFVMKSMSMCND